MSVFSFSKKITYQLRGKRRERQKSEQREDRDKCRRERREREEEDRRKRGEREQNETIHEDFAVPAENGRHTAK